MSQDVAPLAQSMLFLAKKSIENKTIALKIPPTLILNMSPKLVFLYTNQRGYL